MSEFSVTAGVTYHVSASFPECEPGNVEFFNLSHMTVFPERKLRCKVEWDLVLETILKTVHRKAISKVIWYLRLVTLAKA